jgi:outer membrane cobalamin receptor
MMTKLKTLFLILTLITSFSFTSIAFSQAADEEELVVTGSRIVRPEISSNAPVSVIRRDDILKSGYTSIGDLLLNSPLITGTASSTSKESNGGNGGTYFSLRGIGEERTLVLLNGRRLPPMGLGAAASPDLGAIPPAMVERIEIFKDGASAIYGSDAVAGVVNIITRTDFEGVEASVYSGVSSEGDGRQDEFTFVGGLNSGKSNMVFSVSMAEQHGTLMGSRPWSLYDIDSNDPDTPASTKIGNCDVSCVGGGSSAPPWSRLVIADYADGGVTLGQGFMENATNETGYVSPGAAEKLASAANYLPYSFSTHKYNYNPVNWLQSPNKRWNATFGGTFDLGDAPGASNLKITTEVLYTNIKSQSRIAPQPLAPLAFYTREAPYSKDNFYNQTYGPKFTTTFTNVDAEGVALTDGGYDLVDGAYVVNADGEGTHNRVRTLDAANGSSVDINDWRRRMVENLGRFDDRDVHNYRVMLALGGEFDNDWKFDISYVYGKNDSAAIAGGYFDLSKVAEQVGPTYTDDNGVLKCGADSTTTISDACVPLNIFGQNVVTQEMIDYSSVDATVQGLNEQRVISAIFNGPVADYDGGTIYAAVGYENRDETGATVQDSLIIDGKLTDRSGLNTSGGYSLEEIFAEFIIPFYDRAELQIAARSSDYSSFGTNTTAELGLEVYMTENSTFRIASSMAYRAPNTPDLYGGRSLTFPEVRDPCAQKKTGETSAEYATRLATLPGCALVGNGYQTDQDQLNETTGGNPNLQPEESTSASVGFVFTPVDGLELSLDFWQVDIENTIGTFGVQNILDECAAQNVDLYCGLITRYDAPPELKNHVKGILNVSNNVGEASFNGADFYLNYNAPEAVNGWNYSLGTLLAYTGKYEETIIGISQIDYVGIQNEDKFGLVPDLRGNFFVNFSKDIYSIDLIGRYIGGVEEELPGDITREVESVVFLDFKTSFDFDPLTLNIGINNILNQDPPFVDTGFNANTSVENYDILGAFGYVRLSLRF